MKNWLILLGLGLLGIALFAASAVDKISFGTPRIVDGLINWLNSNLTISIPIINGLGIGAQLDAFTGKLYYGPTFLADMRLEEAITIAPNATSEFNITAVAKNTDLLTAIIFNISQPLQMVRVVGTVTINNQGFPINQSVDLNEFI